MSEDRLHILIEAFVEHRLSDDEARELNALLDADDEARREFVRAVDLHASLAQMAADGRGALSLSEALADELPVAREEAPAGAKRASGRRAASVLRRPRAAMSWTPYVIIPLSVAAAAFLVLSIGGGDGDAPPRGESASPVATRDHASPSDPAAPPRVAETKLEAAVDAPPAVARDPSLSRARPGDVDETQDDEPILAAVEADAPVVPVVPDAGDTRENEPAAADVAPAAGHLAYLDYLEGDVELLKSGLTRWAAPHTGAPIGGGDRLRTRFARARIAFESGTIVHVNRFTTFELSQGERANGLDLVGGEVYVETVPADVGFWVATPHGRAVDFGTRFGVKAESRRGTTVTVVEGDVEASTDAAKVALQERQEVILVRRAVPPGAVRAVADPAARFAWARAGVRSRAVYIAAATHSHLRIKDPMKVTRAPRGSLVGRSIVSDTDMGRDRAANTARGGTAAWRIVLPRSGEWFLWARLYSAGGDVTRNSEYGDLNDPNSFWVKVDSAGEKVLGNHKKDEAGQSWYNRWHWGGNGAIEVGTPRGLKLGQLDAGEHIITVRSRDSLRQGGRLYSPILDALCLTDDATYLPTDEDLKAQFRR